MEHFLYSLVDKEREINKSAVSYNPERIECE